MKQSQLAINSISNSSHSMEEFLPAYEKAGFRNVELWFSHIRKYLDAGHSPADLQALLDGHGLQCIGGFEGGVECFSPQAQKKRNHRRVIENARLLAELGGSILVAGTDGPAEGQPRDFKTVVNRIAESFAAIGRQIRRTGVTLCIEFNWGPVVKSLRTAAAIARRARVKNVGVLFDPAHYHCTTTKLEDIDAETAPYIRHMHMNDMRDQPGDLSQCNADRVLPGQGCLDLQALIGRIEKNGYRGYFSIEMFSKKLREMSAGRSARMMYDSLLPLCRNGKTSGRKKK